MSLESCVLLLVRRYADHCLEPKTERFMQCKFGPGSLPRESDIEKDFGHIWSESPQFRKVARQIGHLWDPQIGCVVFNYGLYLSKEILKNDYMLNEAVESLRDEAERFVTKTFIRFILPAILECRKDLVEALKGLQK